MLAVNSQVFGVMGISNADKELVVKVRSAPLVRTFPNAPLAIYRYILSYSEVVGLYLLTNKKILIVLSSERVFIPEQLEGQPNDLFKSKPWLHYFSCD